MAWLFKHKLLTSKIIDLQVPDLEEKVQLLQNRYDAQKSWSLEKKTETECEQAFNDDVFKQVLWYTSYPSNPFTIDPKWRTQTSWQKPDAILWHFNPDETDSHKHTQVVVEIKDAKTPLDKSQKREWNLSPVQQGFKYKPQYQNCKRVIATNFIEIRLYKDTLIDFEIRTLEDLVDPSNDYENFKKFWWLLNADHLISTKGPSITEALLSEVRSEQEKITKKFYKEYKQLRMELIQDLIKNNPDKDYNMLITKAQKIIDRLIFVHFCEDLGLLPEEKLAEVVAYGDNMIGVSTWTILAGFFEAVNSGSDKLWIPKWYNWWLFHKDDELDHLKVGDDICKKFVEMWEYDFADDLSVNILGHIFEQSISDLEDLRNHFSEAEDKGTSKRKKDGIFYTPEYIVDYIVKNSLGVWLEEQYKIIEKKVWLNDTLDDKKYEKKELEAYGLYQQVLQNVKVLDPACGSWAFLVRVFDYLLAENERVWKKLWSLFDNQATYKSILQNNIYWVDLNEESVEITKLSLWLKTAEKGKKLADLDGNIKCGNSLIDDPAVAGEKAFDWSKEYKDIMNSWGFDVVVGNPPYWATISKLDQKYYMESYSTALYKLDTYSLFAEKWLSILRQDWMMSYIIPYTRLTIQQHKKLRELLLSNNLSQIIDLPVKVFQDADLDTVILFVWKKKPDDVISVWDVQDQQITTSRNLSHTYILWTEWLIINLYVSKEDIPLLKKITSKTNTLWKSFDVSQWLIPYDKYRWHTSEQIKWRVFHSVEKLSEEYKKELRWEDVWRYKLTPNDNLYIKYWAELAAPRDQKFFTKERLLIREITRWSYYKLYVSYADKELYNTPVIINIVHKDDTNEVSLKYLLALMNSKLYTYYHIKVNPKALAKTSIPKILVNDVRNLPLPEIDKESQQPYIEKADQMLAITKEYNDVLQQTLSFLESRYSLEKMPKKLQKITELNFDSFKKALKLKKLSLEDEEELMSWFNKKHTVLSDLQSQIGSIDREIDEMVFDLYELTDEEREIVLAG